MYRLSSFYQVLATNYDESGIEYTSMTEALNYPFYTVQFHPERNMYRFDRDNIPHSDTAIELTTKLAERLVSDAAKSTNLFTDFQQYVSYSLENNGEFVISLTDPTDVTNEYVFIHAYP